jgi:hypothetical protein
VRAAYARAGLLHCACSGRFPNSCPGGQIRFAAPADFSVGVPSRPIAARIPASRCFSGAHAFFGLTREPPFLWPFFPNGLLVTASRRYSARTSSGSAMRKFSHCPSGMCRIKTLRQPRRHLPDRLAASQSQLRFEFQRLTLRHPLVIIGRARLQLFPVWNLTSEAEFVFPQKA